MTNATIYSSAAIKLDFKPLGWLPSANQMIDVSCYKQLTTNGQPWLARCCKSVKLAMS